MSCAACSSRVECAVAKTEGVTDVSVNLLTGTMTVEGAATDEAVIASVVSAGYGAAPFTEDSKKVKPKPNDGDGESRSVVVRFAVSVGLLLLLMYLSMGHVMWGFPVPSFLARDPVGIGIAQMLLTGAVLVVNKRFFVSGLRGLLHRAPNMDSLVATGSGTAFVYSTVELFIMSGNASAGNLQAAFHGLHSLYFESAAMIPALITLGKMLESFSKGRTTNALKDLAKLVPDTAAVEDSDGNIREIPVSDVRVGDVFILRPGDRVPVDGEIIYGSTAVDCSALTGESIPAEITVGDTVNAATVNLTGYVKCRATRVGADTAHAGIIKMVEDAAATKAPIAKIADKVAGVFVPVVMAIAAVTAIVWLMLGRDVGFSLARGISVLVISCPCALGLATPVAIMVGSGVGARNGILYKNASILEECGRVNIVALDKTGTITEGNPEITDVIPADGFTEEEILSIAYALEIKSEHPLAKAVIRKCEERGISVFGAEDFIVHPGGGLEGTMDGRRIFGGSLRFVSEMIDVTEDIMSVADSLSRQGRTLMLFGSDDRAVGIIGAADKIRDDSASAISELRDMGIHVVMLTGDNNVTAEAVGADVGVSQIIGGLLPGDKAERIAMLKKHNKVAMVGDGINDAPSLAVADVGIAIGTGTDIAVDSADVVLMNSRLSDVAGAIRLSRSVMRNIKENLFWAFAYNIIGIPLAAGVFINLTGWEMNPMFGAVAMSLSSFFVVTNALRLNLTDIRNSKKDKKTKKTKENEKMEKVMKIEGMMCPHCEARVKKILEEIEGVESAVTSHKEGTAVLTLTTDVKDSVLKEAVEAQGYKVL